jgi:hypothetical protein
LGRKQCFWVAILKNCLECHFQGFACRICPIQPNFHSILVSMTCAGQRSCPPLIYTYIACSPPTNLCSPNCSVTPWKYYSLSRMACANKSRSKAPGITCSIKGGIPRIEDAANIIPSEFNPIWDFHLGVHELACRRQAAGHPVDSVTARDSRVP